MARTKKTKKKAVKRTPKRTTGRRITRARAPWLWQNVVASFALQNTAKDAIVAADEVVAAFKERYGDEL